MDSFNIYEWKGLLLYNVLESCLNKYLRVTVYGIETTKATFRRLVDTNGTLLGGRFECLGLI